MSNFKNPLAFATCSLGQPHHTLPQKLTAIASAGFNGIELSLPDLQSFASLHFRKEIVEDDYTSLSEATTLVREQCKKLGLEIMVLQPFSNFEGWPRGSQERKDAFERARGWVEIMSAAGTRMLQVGSSDSPGIEDASMQDVVDDLRELADMLNEKGFRVAYENWCWATRAPGWKDVWEIVKLADRENLGLCLDTFQTAGGEWGDPTTHSGIIETINKRDLERKFEDSLKELTNTIPPEKIFFLQVSDAYRVEPPLDVEPDENGLRARGRWSHDFRPLPFEGGYLPIGKVFGAVMGTGFKGWVSVEVFDGREGEKYKGDLERFARRGMEGVGRLLREAVDGIGN
ncbi:xylose isomerase-like TIM barrel [Colletotrichum plurivorum]|uniref:Xylose isomerase-like TIM barrel n=1 Tax=Colletotrichum plurivorum TaxID=2175906 RepID=A0A8H6JVE9_9PEZI|nr:xylose isomerase-like TIM barrel [Colletotrichum plurivorum]